MTLQDLARSLRVASRYPALGVCRLRSSIRLCALLEFWAYGLIQVVTACQCCWRSPGFDHLVIGVSTCSGLRRALNSILMCAQVDFGLKAAQAYISQAFLTVLGLAASSV